MSWLIAAAFVIWLTVSLTRSGSLELAAVVVGVTVAVVVIAAWVVVALAALL